MWSTDCVNAVIRKVRINTIICRVCGKEGGHSHLNEDHKFDGKFAEITKIREIRTYCDFLKKPFVFSETK